MTIKKSPKSAIRSKSVIPLSLEVKRDTFTGEKLPDAYVYVFNTRGILLERKKIENVTEAKIQLNIAAELKGQKIQVVVGPDVELETDASCLAEKLPFGTKPKPRITPQFLERRGGVMQKATLKESLSLKPMFVKTESLVKWLMCKCTVKGRLVKTFTLPDGSMQDMGVSYACVFIWEVDKFYYILEKLPQYEIFRLRDELIDIIEKWPPEPWPPFVEAGPFPIQTDTAAELDNIHTLATTTDEKADPPTSITMLGTSSEALKNKKIAEFDKVFTAQSAVSLRREMVIAAESIIPYLCYFPWLYAYVKKDFLTCTCTDAYGNFERDIYYRCSGDKPDIYFTARQCIDSNWVTLYDPGLRCNVHWDYACGTEVRLVTTVAGARVCAEPEVVPPPAVYSWVEPHGLGSFNFSQLNNDGSINYNHNFHTTPVLIENAPFGSTVGFRMGHSNNIPNDQVKYYRIEYKKTGTSKWFECLRPVTRHYVHEKDDHISYPVVALGPVPSPKEDGTHLFHFKPKHPKDLDSSLDNTEDQWLDDNFFPSDLYSGYLNTADFTSGSGQYQIRITIYDKDGDPVDPYKETPEFDFIAPINPDSGNSATSTEVIPAKFKEPGGKGFVFNLMVDNRPCTASLALPEIDGVVFTEIDLEENVCGFFGYESGDDITLRFTAKQAGNNAITSFGLKRGHSNVANMHLSYKEIKAPTPPELIANDFYNVDDGNFHKTIAISAIMAGCTNAAFAESLHVYAKATNGWIRLSGFDAYGLRAFALAQDDPS